ncbi:MAG: hypothetical protein CML29_09020 [Rhizobiales bacterium]|nr:hypothetical protein [Hyphomicrobiales bacterium]MBA70808.1 hypothetical protein [Hyphomicrobiales bacterium]
MKTALTTVATACVLLVLSLSATLAADDWNGDWESRFGQLRLLENGDRLYGDLADKAVIEGRISPDGRTARAVVVYENGSWMLVEWRRAQDRIAGNWASSGDGLPTKKNGQSWTATRMSARTSLLKFADQFVEKYPTIDTVFGKGPAPAWIAEIAGPSPTASVEPSAPPAQRTEPREGLSNWYASFSLDQLTPAYEADLDVINYRGVERASANIVFSVYPGHPCPATMNTGFCDELGSRADERGYVRAETTAARIGPLPNGGEALWVSFRLPGDTFDRLLLITARDRASIHHPTRGYDYEGTASRRTHICERAPCTRDVFDEARRENRHANAAGYQNFIYALPNRIAESRRNGRPEPQRTQGQRKPERPRSQMSDAWVILDETSENLGTISIRQDGTRLAASGELNGFFETGRPHETQFSERHSTREAVAFDLTVSAGSSGERKSGRLVVELPAYRGDNPRGTLIVGEEIFLVSLVRPMQGMEPAEVGDTPAIGIYSMDYLLTNVPAGKTLKLRKEPGRSASVVGELSAGTAGLQMMKCEPEIDSWQFEHANPTDRLAMLSAAWCQVTNGRFAGWLPGRYLKPMDH